MKLAVAWLTVAMGLGLATAVGSARAGTIADAKAAGVGVEVTIEYAVITSTVDLITDETAKHFHLQDETGGITVYGPNAAIDDLLTGTNVGDAVAITGTTGQYYGVFEIDLEEGPCQMVRIGPADLPELPPLTPLAFHDGSVVAEMHESMAVLLKDVVFTEFGEFEGDTNYLVTNGLHSATVRVSTFELSIIGEPIPTWPVDIIGIVSQYDGSEPFDSNYQLLIRNGSDMTATGTNFAPAVVGQVRRLNRGEGPIALRLNAWDPDGKPAPLVVAIASGADAPRGEGPSRDLPFAGKLTDPGREPPANDVTGGGILLGREVVFTPDPDASGWFVLTFTADDGADVSRADVHLFIQDTGTLVITEIMYDPANVNPGKPTRDGNWQWIEVHNPTADTLFLHSLFNDRFEPEHEANVFFEEVPAGETRLIVRGDWLAPLAGEWNALVEPLDMIPVYSEGPFFDDGHETLMLFGSSDPWMYDDARLLDVVDYWNGEVGWPSSNNRGSLFLRAGHLDTVENDEPGNWAISVAGFDGAVATPEDPCPPADSDEGSPLVLPTSSGIPPLAPTVEDLEVFTNVNDGSVTIELLEISDDPAPVTYTISSMPTRCLVTDGGGGTLTDPGNNHAPILAGDMLTGAELTWHPMPDLSGTFAFGYRADDGATFSNYGYVTLHIQETSRVVITEIMYNPANEREDHWEWIEILNLTGVPIPLNTLMTDATVRAGLRENLLTRTLLPYAVMVIAPGQNDSRTLEEFVAEWNPGAAHDRLAMSDLLVVDPEEFPRLSQDGRAVRLYDSEGSLLDVVRYAGGTGGWPATNGESSVYLRPHRLSPLDNDNGLNWLYAIPGFESAYRTPDDPEEPPDSDVGSPALLPAPVNLAPQADDVRLGVRMNTAHLVELPGLDDGLPGGPLTRVITELPRHGTLVDPTTGHQITESMLPYSPAGNGTHVRYTPDPGYTSRLSILDGDGDDTFTFHVDDGELWSVWPGTVTLVVQSGRVVISEVMIDPANEPDADWQWVEVYNPGSEAVFLHTLTDDDQEFDNRLRLLTTIPAGSTRIIASSDNGTRSESDFLSEWYDLSPAVVLFAEGGEWELLEAQGDRLQLLDTNGQLLEDVLFQPRSSWPSLNGSASVYVRTEQLDAVANDQGTAWRLSATAIDHAYATPDRSAGGATDASDVGSPGRLPGQQPESSTAISITAWRSVRDHGASGALAIALDAEAGSATATCESRNGGVRRIEIDFDANVSGALIGTIDIEDLNAGTTIPATQMSLTNDDHTLVVEFADGLPDQACYRIDLHEHVVALNGDADCLIRTLPGDLNGDGVTNLIDAAEIKGSNGQSVEEHVALDINTDGVINLIDFALVKGWNGISADCP